MRKLAMVSILAGAVLAVALTAWTSSAEARPGPHGGLRFRAPVFVVAPELVMIPGTRVWFYPGVEHEVFFYAGAWWAPFGGVWYRAPTHGGPWVMVSSRYVPASIVGVPGGYRALYGHHPRVGWREVRQWHRRGGPVHVAPAPRHDGPRPGVKHPGPRVEKPRNGGPAKHPGNRPAAKPSGRPGPAPRHRA
jgi:hypothetical protein